MTLLLDVDASMPASPYLDGCKHASLSTHVTEGGLPTPMGTTTSDSGDTGNCTSSTPGGSAVAHTGIRVNGVGLPPVLGDVGVNEMHDIGSNWGEEDSGEGHMLIEYLGGIIGVEYGDEGN